MQWITNAFSVILLPIYVFALFAIHRRSALRVVIFSYIYFLDTLYNIAFTIVFCVKWFALARKADKLAKAKATQTISNIAEPTETVSSPAETEEVQQTSVTNSALPSQTIDEFSEFDDLKEVKRGFHIRAYEAVETGIVGQDINHSFLPDMTIEPVITSAATQLISEITTAVSLATITGINTASATLTALPSPSPTSSALPTNQSASLAQENAISITITVLLLLTRIYFTLVIVAYARTLVRQHNLRRRNGYPRGSFNAKVQYWALAIGESFWTGLTRSNNTPSGGTLTDPLVHDFGGEGHISRSHSASSLSSGAGSSTSGSSRTKRAYSPNIGPTTRLTSGFEGDDPSEEERNIGG